MRSSALIIAILLFFTESKALDNELDDPESEIASALQSLDNLASRIETASQMNARKGLGPQNIASERAFSNALKFYGHKEWQSVIREVNNYLNLSQVPQNRDYLQAQYMVARAYEETRMPMRALRAYFRYIAAYMTDSQKNEDEFIDVLRRMIPLAAADTQATSELRKLLSSVTTLSLPENIRPEVLFIAAKSAAKDGNRKLAESWLEQVLSTTNDMRLKAKALYISAILAISINDLDSAEAKLSKIIQIDDGKNTSDGYSNQDLARLALARIAIRQKKHKLSMKYFDAINQESPSYKDALFESIYVHLGLNEDNEARNKALLFLARFAETPESMQLRQILAYLDLRAGDIESAQASMNAADKKFDQILNWMKNNLSGLTSIDQNRLHAFLSISQLQLKTHPSIEAAKVLFSRMAESTRRLADVEGEMRDLVYTVGRANIEQLRPTWAARTEQLAKLADDALSISHRLAATERNLFAKRTPDLVSQQLKASEERRTKLLTPAASAGRQAHFWSGLSQLLELTSKIAIEHRKLSASQASIAAAKQLIENTKNKDLQSLHSKRIEELENQVSRANQATTVTLTRLRKAKIHYLIQQSPHHATRKFLAQYATAMHEESGLLQGLRNTSQTTSERLLSEDTAKAWKRWHYVVDRLFSELDALDSDIRNNINKTLNNLEEHETHHQKISDMLREARTKLEQKLAKSISLVVDQYAANIEQRQSRHRKWSADIEWLQFQSLEQKSKEFEEKFQIEKQVLQDNLTDLEQGVLWRWPD